MDNICVPFALSMALVFGCSIQSSTLVCDSENTYIGICVQIIDLYAIITTVPAATSQKRADCILLNILFALKHLPFLASLNSVALYYKRCLSCEKGHMVYSYPPPPKSRIVFDIVLSVVY